MGVFGGVTARGSTPRVLGSPLRSCCAQSTRGVLSFFGSLLTSAWAATLAPSSPAWGSTGKRLFGEGTTPGAFRLVDTQLASTGAVLHVYERAGDLRYGEVEVGQETVIFDSDVAHR